MQTSSMPSKMERYCHANYISKKEAFIIYLCVRDEDRYKTKHERTRDPQIKTEQMWKTTDFKTYTLTLLVKAWA